MWDRSVGNVISQIYEACGMLKERKFEREFVIDVDNPEWREEGEGDIMPSGELEKELFV